MTVGWGGCGGLEQVRQSPARCASVTSPAVCRTDARKSGPARENRAVRRAVDLLAQAGKNCQSRKKVAEPE
jgi:hypothetical protein